MANTQKVTQPAGAATTAGPGPLAPAIPAPPVLPAPQTSDSKAQAQLEETRKAATQAVLDSAEAQSAAAEPGARKTVTGVDSALVTVRKADGSLLYSAVVLRGQDVPADTPAAELDRLEALGVFDAPAAAAPPQTEDERLAARLTARG